MKRERRMIPLFLIATIILLLCGCGISPVAPVTAGRDLPESENSTSPSDGELKVIFLDVGQGNAQLILTPSGKTMLIDGGNNGQEDEMFAYLNHYNVKKIDVLIGSHPDADHIGTFPELVNQFDIRSIYMPKITSNTKTFEDLLLSIKNKGLKVNTAKAGVVIPFDESVTVDLLGPVNTYEDANEMSAVVKVTFGNTAFLFPGDAEFESEQDMLKSGADLSSDVLAVGHHGSNSSSNLTFLKKVNPEYAVIQVGANNRYGHPTEMTLQKLKQLNIEVLRTDEHGTIAFTTNGTTVKVSTEK